MEKNYRPAEFEAEVYREWEESGAFTARRVPGKKPFTIVIPPPNITSQLHVGHAMDTAMQDCLIRFHRMIGDPTLWVPGTDHASIATEVKILAAMREDGQTKETLGREGFLERAWEWKNQYGGAIVRQLRRLGASCDWSRERFTMDEGCNEAVKEVFVRLYEKGLIYRANRIVNWCPTCKTAISDAEVEYEERQSSLWHIRYPGDGFSLVVATTRPETMLGDTAVAVNPDDERYIALVGKTVTLPIMNRQIPIVADAYAQAEFGSGAVKVTPAHDPNDYEIALRHNLPIIRVMNDDGTMNAAAREYEGMAALDAREKIVAKLTELGLLVKIEPYTHNVSTCYRCKHTIEPLTSDQWFVRMEPLAKPAIAAVRDGSVKFSPERYASTYFHWMENIRDWCVSRQLWWGHRIPAWFCQDCGHINVARHAPERCEKCGSANLRQDDDVLDTWFSSALWPFSTLGWPEDTEDLRYFYPTSVLVTAYDIIFFWVARMIFSAVRHTGMAPFKHVYIHGMIRDEHGRKMSKSAGNGIDPLDIIGLYGADALRFALTIGNAPGNDLRLSDEKVIAARNFANKLWNASRFVLSNLGEKPAAADAGMSSAGAGSDASCGDASAAAAGITISDENMAAADRWIISELNECVREASDNLERFELGVALQKIYDFIWDVFCDWYIEIVKPRLMVGADTASGGSSYGGSGSSGSSGGGGSGGDSSGGRSGSGGNDSDSDSDIGGGSGSDSGGSNSGSGGRAEALAVLRFVLVRCLKLLHPFMPFITEEIYSNILKCPDIEGNSGISAVIAAEAKTASGSIMIEEWPAYGEALSARAESKMMSHVIDVIRAIRNLRSEMNVPPSKKLSCVFVAGGAELADALAEGRAYIERLSGLRSFEIRKDKSGITAGDVTVVAGGVEAFIPLGELVDIAAERERLKKELDNLAAEIERAGSRLENPGFVGKAPQNIVEAEREKLKAYMETRCKVQNNLERLDRI